VKFYIIEVEATGETLGCELGKKAAVEYAQSRGYAKDEIVVRMEDVPVTPDAIRRLLGQLGGYANY
jgi:hypothetical protein